MCNIVRGKMNRRRCTCAISHAHTAAAVIFQLLVNLSQKLFLQKMIRNDVLSDRKVLQRFRGIGKWLFTSFLV